MIIFIFLATLYLFIINTEKQHPDIRRFITHRPVYSKRANFDSQLFCRLWIVGSPLILIIYRDEANDNSVLKYTCTQVRKAQECCLASSRRMVLHVGCHVQRSKLTVRFAGRWWVKLGWWWRFNHNREWRATVFSTVFERLSLKAYLFFPLCCSGS